jgi:hypothetical protein
MEGFEDPVPLLPYCPRKNSITFYKLFKNTMLSDLEEFDIEELIYMHVLDFNDYHQN